MMTHLEGEKGSKMDRKRSKEDKQPTKVVVRHLPPYMTLESFLEQVDVPPHDYICYGPADKTLMPHCTSRVYINFLNVEDLLIFTQKFDGYVLLDNKGHEYQAVVEYAPFQRIARSKSNSSKKKNSKCGTIELDPYFIEFKKNLQEEREKAGSRSFKQHYFETNTENEEKNKITDTPLLQYLRNKNAEKAKNRDEKREERKKKEVERKKMREEQQSLRRAQAKKTEQESQSNIVYTGGPYGNKRDTFARRKQEDRGKPARDKDIPVKNPDAFKSKVSLKTSGGSSEKADRSQDIINEKKSQVTSASATFQDPAIIEMRVGSGNVKLNSRYNRQDSNSQPDRRQKQKEENKKLSSDSKFNKNKDRPNNRENRTRDRGDRFFKSKIQDSEHSAKAKLGDIKTNEENSNGKFNEIKGASQPESPSKFSKTVPNNFKTAREYKTNTPYNSENVDTFRNRKTEKPSKGNYKSDTKTRNPLHKDKNDIDHKASENVHKVPDRVDLKKSEKASKFTDRGSWKQNKFGDKVDPKIVDKTNIATDRSPKKIVQSFSKGIEKQKVDVENVDPKVSPSKLEESGNSEQSSTLDMNPNVLQRRKSFEGKQPERFVESGRRNSLDSGNKNSDDEDGRGDPRPERRIRNKDRPSIAIYRPGMGRFSKQRITADKSSEQDSPSNSPSPTNISKGGGS